MPPSRCCAGGTIEVEGRMLDASNATLYCRVESDELSAQCVYKPVRGERPLWDFPDGTLAGRELAAYEVSEATGWNLVPPTVLRDGPFGLGMVQLWIDIDEAVDIELLVRSDRPQLRRMALFDAVINNADRKGGHLLPVDSGQHVFGIDHGIAFHRDDKLRTLLWGWRGRKLSRGERGTLERIRFDVGLEERLQEFPHGPRGDGDAQTHRAAAAHRRLSLTQRRLAGDSLAALLSGALSRGSPALSRSWLVLRRACLVSEPPSASAGKWRAAAALRQRQRFCSPGGQWPPCSDVRLRDHPLRRDTPRSRPDVRQLRSGPAGVLRDGGVEVSYVQNVHRCR